MQNHIVAIIFLVISFGAYAQSETKAVLNDGNQNMAAGEQKTGGLSELILQLNDPAQRMDLIQGLESIEEKQTNSVNSSGHVIAEVLGVNSLVDVLLDDYRNVLGRYGITDSSMSALVVILLALIVIAAVVWLNQKLSYWFDKRLKTVRKNYNLASNRFKTYFKFQRLIGYLLGMLLAAYTLFEYSKLSKLLSDYVNFISLIESFFSVSLVVFIFVSIWELVNAAAEYIIARNAFLRSARARTLIPMARNILMFLMLLLASMVVLSELGVDIVPLLAGAGVLGIAVGFGAQRLVQDFLTGFTILIEDLLQIGDIVTLASRTGTVEKISIRKIQLRDLNGTVYTIPFSEVSIVENLTKDFSCYLMDIGVAYREDIDEVCDCLKEVDTRLRESAEFRSLILEPLEIMGVDQFADSAVIVKARIKTQPKKQWLVGREFNRRLKYLFDERGIEIPFPHQTVYFGEDKEGKAPKAPVKLYETSSAS